MKDVNVKLIVDPETKEVKGYQYCEDGIEKNFGTAFKEVAKFIETINLAFKELNVPLDLMKDFAEYDELIAKIDKDARRRDEIKKEYFIKSNEIIQKAINENFDFKAVYGGNTKETRQKYADEQLQELVTERQELKYSKDEDARKLGYIKRLIDMKIQLIKYEGK